MMTHGFSKLMNFSSKAAGFPDPIGLGSSFSLGLTVFAEFFCAAFIIVGLLTRLSLVPLIITMAVAAFYIHGGDPIAKQELSLFYLAVYTALLFTGPGKFSLDSILRKA